MYGFITRSIFFISLITSSLAAFAVTPMVAAGNLHTVSLQADGTVMTWGYNYYGQLGDGAATNRSSPAVVPGLIDVVAVAAGFSHTVALKADGTVWAWGGNSAGQLGDGTTTDRWNPVMVPGLTGVIKIAASRTHTIALKSDGTVVAWGYNGFGGLGDGTTTNRLSPVMVPGLSGVAEVAAGYGYTVILKSDGPVMAWGYNNKGQLGDGTLTNRLNPVAVVGLTGGIDVAAGENHTVAVKSDGTVLAWGYNGSGQLGDGTTIDRWSPVVVPGLTGVTEVAAGAFHTIALKSDGTVAAWGHNSKGSLGDGTVTQRRSPVSVVGLTGVMAVDGGENDTLALKLDGTIMAWGYNYYGQLGDGTTVDRLSPVGVLGFGGSVHPALSYSPEYVYIINTVGASPATGFLNTLITYKVVYSHAANTGPSAIAVCIDALPCSALSLDTAATFPLHDGNYTNGEQYVYTTTLAAGTHSYYFTASDGTISANLPTTASLSGPTISDLNITTSSLPGATVGVAYSQPLAATGGTPPYSWLSGGIPPGLSLNTNTGVISGTPTNSGTFAFSVAVVDAAGTSLSTALSIIVAVNPAATVPDAPTIGIATAGDARATVRFTPPANNGGDAIIRYTVSCNPVCTAVSGTASPITVTGLTNGTTYTFTVSATNGVGTGPASAASNSVTPEVPLIPAITSPNPAPCTVGVPCSYQITATNNPFSFGVSNASSPHIAIGVDGFPPGLSVNPYTGLISGIPTMAELYWFDVTATNAAGTGRKSVSFTINSGTTDTTPPTVPTELTASAVSETQINLNWLPSTDNVGVTEYRIYRKSCPASLPDCVSLVGPVLIQTLVGAPPVTTYSDTSVSVGLSYDYYVRACDAANNCSVMSSMARATPLDSTAPTVPTGLAASVVSETQINLNWSPSTDNVGVTLYRIYRQIYIGCLYITPPCMVLEPPQELVAELTGVPPATSFNDTGLSPGTSYSYTVMACDAAGNCSALSAAEIATTLAAVPGAPTIGTATAGDARATVSFTPPSSNGSSITSYTVSCSPTCIPISGTASPITVTGLTNGTAYTFTVTATNGVGTGPASATSNSVTPLGTPTVPWGLTVTSISAKQNNLSWMASYPSVSYYKIYRTANCLPGSVCILGFGVIATVPSTLLAPSYVDISSTDIFASSYGVQACNALGNCSGMSPLVAPVVYDIMPPTIPTGLTATVVSASQINLAWTVSTDNYMVSGYRAYRNGVLIASPTSRSFSDAGLASGSTNSYTIAACDWKGNCSAQSTAVTATTPDNVAPTVPTGLTASTVSATQINLNWTASTDNVGVTSYTVYRNGVPLVSGNVTSYSDTGLTALTSYSYTVLACDAAVNCSAQSAAVAASTPEGVPPTVPTKLATSAASTTQINLTWRASTDNVGVTGYKVYRNGVQVGAPAGTSYSDTGLTAATSYQYTAAACDAAGNCSAQSPAVTGTTRRK